MSDEGSEDLPARPKRKIKRIVVMSSSSSSESDESIVVAGTRRNRLRVVSEDDSESSGSPVICPGTRHKRTLPKLRDSDVESDSSGWETDYSASAKPAPTSTKSQSGFASDSSEGNSEKCSICLMRFTNQEVGTPQNCDHIFCLDCITEWSKNVNTCPVDRISFDSIVVRVCAGGRVVRTEQVHVVERRPSVEWMVVEDPTLCEICQRGDNEESMLLCDGCDRGFHMQCLRPPITRVPIDQWLCPNCIYHVIQIELAGVDEIFNDMSDQETAQQPSEGVRNTRRSSRTTNSTDQPSTSSGSRGRNSNQDEIPTTSNGRQRTHRTAQVSTVARRSTGHRKKPRRRRTKTVIIEYEVQGDGKFPITKTVKRKVKRRKVKRKQSRAASRRRHVLASVRARMQALRPSRPAPRGPAPPLHRGPDIAPRLSLYGDPMQLDYFSDDEERDRTSGGVAAVAVRPSSSVISSFRQARRKMITINSPPHATTAPDILSSILESQTLLHSKNSVVEISVDGNVNIKLQKEREKRRTEMKSSEKVDLSKVEDATRKVPSYGQHRGGGGGRAGGHRASARTPAGPAAGQRPATGGHRPAGLRSAAGPSAGRGDESAAPYQRRPPAAWPLYSHRPPPHRPPPHRPRALATDDPIDMRVAPLAERHHSYGPLPEPPVFKFDKTPDGDNSEDERSDSGLIIDTEKYDPTEPTNDESGDDSPVPGPAPAARGPPAGGVAVSPEVLSSAVRQVLNEHRQLVVNEHRHLSREEPSDEDEDGDCPNFSIYSATSVHIAAEGGAPAPAPAAPPAPSDDLADLVQEDDSPERAAPPAPVDPIKKKPEDEYKEKVSKRCPITTNTRNPIKIKLNSTSLIKRQVSLYDEEEPVDDVESADIPETDVKTADVVNNKEVVNITNVEKELEKNNTFVPLDENSKLSILEDEQILEESVTSPSANKVGNHVEEITDTCKSPKDNGTETGNESATDKGDDDAFNKKDEANDDDDYNFENDINSNDEISEGEFPPARNSRRNSEDKNEEGVEKMTESISETEDERSYTPCLDENKSKDNSFETEKDRGLEGLDTEMISEDEGNEMFSEEEKPASERRTSPVLPPVEENGVPEKRQEDARKKKRKESKRDSKRDGKDKKSKTRKSVIGFKKLSKNGKERNYRDKDKERRDSSDGEKKRKRKEKRKDLERYDVRTVVTEKRRKTKDPFGRDVSPRSRSPTASPARRRRTASGSPVRRRRSPTASPGRRRRSASVSPVRRRRSASVSPVRRRRSASGSAVRLSPAGRRGARRREGERGRKRRRAERSPSPRPKPKPAKRRKRPRSEKRRKSPKRRRTRVSPAGEQSPREASPAEGGAAEAWTSPRTPPPAPPEPARHRPRHRRPRSATGPSKEVFTSGDNILVSVSFKEQERTSDSPERRERRLRRRERRRRRRAAAGLQAGSAPGGLPPAGHAPAGLAPAGHAPVGPALASLATARPVAIIDLERSPFRELTPSPRNVIVLSDSEQGVELSGGAEVVSEVVSSVAGGEAPAVEVPPPVEEAPPTASPPPEDSRGPNTPPDPPSSPDAYDPFEPTRSRSASPEPAAMTLEAAQRTNLSADQLLARRPLSPAEKVMALLQSTRDVSPEPPPAAENSPVAGGAPAVVAAVAAAVGVAAVGGATAGGAGPGSPPAEPRPVVRRPSPIKSEPIKPLPTRRSPSSPGSSDFGDLFEPPAKRDAFDAVKRPNNRPNKLFRKKGGKMQVGVKIDDDNLKILDELPNSAVEMQVKSKFLKKLNRQERVVEEVKLVLKPHFNRKRVTKDEYKDILRRAVPKICHNKSGEINPTKIQALVEAYVKKFQKRHKLGLA